MAYGDDGRDYGYNYDGTRKTGPSASDLHWMKKQQEADEQRAREKAAWAVFCGMLSPIGRLRD